MLPPSYELLKVEYCSCRRNTRKSKDYTSHVHNDDLMLFGCPQERYESGESQPSFSQFKYRASIPEDVHEVDGQNEER